MIKNIYTKNIIWGNATDSITKISQLMKKNNIGFIPIKNNDNYVGVITDRDICISLPNVKSLNDSVKNYMNHNIISIDISSSKEDALNLMKKYKIKRLLVKEKDNIKGILSLSDILNNTFDILNTYKTIFNTHDNKKNRESTIDEFYL